MTTTYNPNLLDELLKLYAATRASTERANEWADQAKKRETSDGARMFVNAACEEANAIEAAGADAQRLTAETPLTSLSEREMDRGYILLEQIKAHHRQALRSAGEAALAAWRMNA